MGDEAWLKGREIDASKKNFAVTGSLVFDFELFIGGLREKDGVTFKSDRSRQFQICRLLDFVCRVIS